MAAGYLVAESNGFVVVHLSGVETGTRMLETARSLLADDAYQPGAPILIDMSGIARMDADARDFLTLGELQTRFVSAHGARSRLAIMAPGDLAYGFGRMYQGFSDEEGQALIDMVADAAEAAAWLELPEDLVSRQMAAAAAAATDA